MKKLALTLIITVAAIAGANAAVLDVDVVNGQIPREDQQDIELYLGKGMMMAEGCGGCCPSECTRCIPTCCPDTRGIFDGGLPKGDCSRRHLTSCKPSYWAGSGVCSKASCA
jgi:hypothetical protein